MNITVRALRALTGLTIPDQPPWGSPHPAHGPGPHGSPLGPSDLPQWHHSRAALQLPTALPLRPWALLSWTHLWVHILASPWHVPSEVPDAWGLAFPSVPQLPCSWLGGGTDRGCQTLGSPPAPAPRHPPAHVAPSQWVLLRWCYPSVMFLLTINCSKTKVTAFSVRIIRKN